MINWPKRPSFILESIAQLGTPKWVSADPRMGVEGSPNGAQDIPDGVE